MSESQQENTITSALPDRGDIQSLAAGAIEGLINRCCCETEDDVLLVLGVLLNTGVAALESVKSGEWVTLRSVDDSGLTNLRCGQRNSGAEPNRCGNEMLVAELTMWIKRLTFSMRNNANPAGVKMANDAMAYLKRKKLISVADVLR